MITASMYFASCTKVMLLAIFILKYGIVLQSESAHAIDYSVKNQDPATFKEVYLFSDKYKIYNMSNHVFYWLYTREQPKGQLLNRSDPNMIKSTNFNVVNPTKILVHDWLGSFHEKECFCAHIVQAYLLVGVYNVICVDWMQFSFDIMYASAKINVKYIGYDIAKVLNILSNDMSSVGSENIHLIGHGLGAHIVGYTGKMLSGKISRITGLDPAKQLYENTDPKYRINKNDATFVDIIHTNGNGFGLIEPLGHIDFYPNGGKTQMNCRILDRVTGGACSHTKAFNFFAHSILARKECKALQCTKWSEYEAASVVNSPKVHTWVNTWTKTGACSHVRSYHYYAHSIWSRNDYIAYRCSSWADFQANRCENASKNLMGEYSDREKEDGDYYLEALVQD